MDDLVTCTPTCISLCARLAQDVNAHAFPLLSVRILGLEIGVLAGLVAVARNVSVSTFAGGFHVEVEDFKLITLNVNNKYVGRRHGDVFRCPMAQQVCARLTVASDASS